MTLTLIEGIQLLLTTGVGLYLRAYLSKKADNLASKEDLNHLTEIAERIRSQFSQVNTVHKAQFEAEFQAYQALWSAAHSARVTHIRWRSLAFKTTEVEIDAFHAAQFAFADSVVRCEPFIPEVVLREFKVLDELFVNAKIDYRSEFQKTPATIQEDRKTIEQAAQKCVAAMRARLSEVLVV